MKQNLFELINLKSTPKNITSTQYLNAEIKKVSLIPTQPGKSDYLMWILKSLQPDFLQEYMIQKTDINGEDCNRELQRNLLICGCIEADRDDLDDPIYLSHFEGIRVRIKVTHNNRRVVRIKILHQI